MPTKPISRIQPANRGVNPRYVTDLAEAWNELGLDPTVSEVLTAGAARMRAIDASYREFRNAAADTSETYRRVAAGELSILDAVVARQSIKTARETAVAIADAARRIIFNETAAGLRLMAGAITATIERAEADLVAKAAQLGAALGDADDPEAVVRMGGKAPAAWKELTDLQAANERLGRIVLHLRYLNVIDDDVEFLADTEPPRARKTDPPALRVVAIADAGPRRFRSIHDDRRHQAADVDPLPAA